MRPCGGKQMGTRYSGVSEAFLLASRLTAPYSVGVSREFYRATPLQFSAAFVTGITV